MAIKKGKDIKLNIKPVLGALIHDNVFEGPCRFGGGVQLTAEFDRMASAEAFKVFKNDVNEYFGTEEFNILEPFYFERNEEFLGISEDILAEITKDEPVADVYLFASSGRIYDYMLSVAQKTGKPQVTVQWCCNNTIETAMLISRGFEGYSYTTWEETLKMMRVLRVRKVLRETNIMLLTRGNSTMAPISCSDGFLSLDQVTKDIGPKFRMLDIHEFLDQLTPRKEGEFLHTLPSRGVTYNLTEEEIAGAEKLADELIAGAKECVMEKKYIVNSLKVYTLCKKMMNIMDCSAMTAPCPEACATTRLNAEQATFCLSHSLLNEEGIPSACEYDIPGLVSMIMLNNFSMGASYLGNTYNVELAKKRDGNLTSNIFRFYPDLMDVVNSVEDEDERNNLVGTAHSVPNRKMDGYDKEPSAYRISPFTASGWGATFRRNFYDDKGKTITMARFSPDGKSIFVARGKIQGAVGYNSSGCTTGVIFSVKDRIDFHRKQCLFGNHIPLVYGDVFDEVVELGNQLGLKVITA